MVDRQWYGTGKTRGRLAGVMILTLGGALLAAPRAKASSPDEVVLDGSALAMLEQRADEAKPQDQCYLYTEVLHGLTESAGRAMTDGDEERVSTTMRRIDAVLHKMQAASARDAHRLKNAEQLMEHTQRRLSDMAHVASNGEHEVVQSTLQHLDRMHTALLTMVFSR